MTVVDHTRLSPSRETIDLAGTAWPLYKIEALVVGVLVFLTVLVVTLAMQPAVLTAAAAAVLTWWVRRLASASTNRS